MKEVINYLYKHRQNYKEHGASLIEYALLIALVAVIAIASIRAVGKSVKCSNFIAAYELGKRPSANGWQFNFEDGTPLGVAEDITIEQLRLECLNGNFDSHI